MSRVGTCSECEAEFKAGPKGRIPLKCPACRAKPAERNGGGTDSGALEPEEGAVPYRRDHLLALADMAVARGIDPVEALLARIAEAIGAASP